MLGQGAPTSISAGGFTLVEALTVVAIVAILTALAAPSFKEIIEEQRARAAATDLYIALTRARSEAIKRNVSVTLTPKTGEWTNGWQILDPVTSAVIEDHGALKNLTATGPGSVSYLNSGRVRGIAAPNFQISGSLTSSTRCIAVDLSGRPLIKKGPC